MADIQRLAARVKETSALLDEYTSILGQAEHTQRLLSNPNWTGLNDVSPAFRTLQPLSCNLGGIAALCRPRTSPSLNGNDNLADQSRITKPNTKKNSPALPENKQRARRLSAPPKLPDWQKRRGRGNWQRRRRERKMRVVQEPGGEGPGAVVD